ncbi:DNA primase large subunit-like isoform X2 [Dreissena polymorpha]|uniref:DNA primase large subunit-like isoform X2 n=1 Tax=Dreissena polymorpha TaxID=45954 RepID=UPI002263C1BB|nr:DNA primase large subunit-like isoform X2 [Dreissena polymorpha]
MDFRNIKRIKRKANGNTALDSYCSRLQLYKVPPTDTISLYEFEEYAIERLKVLKAIETASEKYVKTSDEYDTFMWGQLRTTQFAKLTKSHKSQTEDEEDNFARLDHISHFILRLAYCRSEELRRWFMTQELDLFRFRFKTTSDQEKRQFLEQNDLHYESLTPDERSSICEKLAAASNTTSAVVETVEFFKKTARALPHLEEDERLLPMLSGLSKRYLGADYSIKKNNVGQITADMIDMLSKKAFPLCMQSLHVSLRQSHHLKHGGRQQYGLFLKGIGLSLEEAMKFWRIEFCKLIDVDKFDKQYSYNIRHNYGKEGKRADYTPYSCMKIIMSNAPGPGDSHGCPFKHIDQDLLKQRLKTMNIGDQYLDKIVSEVKTGRYNVACTRYFEATHKLPLEYQAQAISHPNQYFEESQRASNGESKVPVIGTPRRVGSQGASQATQGAKGPDGNTTRAPARDEMDDDFDITDAELSMQA